jgi:hypothetical protein
MKKLTSICVGLSFFLSTCAVAEEHLIAGKEHTTAAVVHGAEGHTRILMEHAKAALEDTLEASLTAKGVQKSHLEAAAKELQVCLDLAGNGHIGAATMHAEAAEKHIKASEKK